MQGTRRESSGNVATALSAIMLPILWLSAVFFIIMWFMMMFAGAGAKKTGFTAASEHGGTGKDSKSRRPKRVCIIGAGPSGLACAKEMMELGHKIVVYESASRVGGVYASAYKGATLTTSSVNTAFGALSDGRESEPKMWSVEEYVAYLENYASWYKLWPHIRFKCPVLGAWRDKSAGVWKVQSPARWTQQHSDVKSPEKSETGEIVEQFDHLAVCCGANQCPSEPYFEGMESFRGTLLHSSAYKNAEAMRGKRVVIVGLGESGSDIALQVARVASACCLSTRAGPGYVIPRYSLGSVTDLDTNRCYHSLPRWLGKTWLLRFKSKLEDWIGARTAPHPKQPSDQVLARAGAINRTRGLPWQNRFGTKNTSFVQAMVCHGAVLRPGVASFGAKHVVFSDGSEFKCDVVLCCTGFQPRFQFLEEKEPKIASAASRARAHLYKHMILPELGVSAAWLGFARPAIGSIPPIAELQARYYALLVSGHRELPTVDDMRRTIRDDDTRALAQYGHDARRIGALTDYLPLLEDLAAAIGCRPNVWKLVSEHPRLWFRVMFGPLCGAQYRLCGPGAMPKRATEALLRTPTMPLPVLAYEATVLALCKIASGLGAEAFATVGL